MKRVLPLLLLGLSVGLWASEPFTLTSAEQENKLGEEAYQEILQKEKRCTDQATIDYVLRVAGRVQAAAPDKGFKYEVTVLESEAANAFCLPGGKIAVYTGILPFCKNEAGLAAVLGHEIAHAVARHGGQRMTQNAVLQTLGSGLGALLDQENLSKTTQALAAGGYNAVAQVGVLLPYSRSHEHEADDMGINYMARAGYQPKEAVELWKRMSTMKSALPAFLSTHPASTSRVEELEEQLPRALRRYEKSPKYGSGENVPERYSKVPQPPKKSEEAKKEEKKKKKKK